MDKIIGIGNALVDILAPMENDKLLDELDLPKGSMQLIDEDRLLKVREKLAAMKTQRSSGGSAANTAYALANLGSKPGYIGKVGEDEMGEFYENTLEKQGVETRLLKCGLPSGIASTFISPDGERTFATYLGASGTICADDLSRSMFEGYSYLYIEGYLLQDHDLVLRAIQLAKESGMQICLDMASYNVVESERAFFDQLITKYVDIVFANESEARAYTGKEPMEALQEIASKCSIAIVKTGKEGSLVKKGTEFIQVLPHPIKKVVDTTGAGDYYAAGFLYALTSGYSLEKCAQISAIVAEAVIQSVGTNLSKRKWNEIKLNIDEVLQA
ncbi:adenosine kinase [Bacteroides ilei]|uniref:adenosine kinase n=1 Tax=Bacteroides ilei TaxID=1907658 RepID=UPI00093107D5|nr:adenosine kinase [Bacteroides ilei]